MTAVHAFEVPKNLIRISITNVSSSTHIIIAESLLPSSTIIAQNFLMRQQTRSRILFQHLDSFIHTNMPISTNRTNRNKRNLSAERQPETNERNQHAKPTIRTNRNKRNLSAAKHYETNERNQPAKHTNRTNRNKRNLSPERQPETNEQNQHATHTNGTHRNK